MPIDNLNKEKEIQLSSQILDYQALNNNFTNNQKQIQHYLQIILLNIKAENISYESVQSTIDDLLQPSRSHAFSPSFISFLKTTKKRVMTGDYLDNLIIELISMKSAYTAYEINFVLERPNPKMNRLISNFNEMQKAGNLSFVLKWFSEILAPHSDNQNDVKKAAQALAKRAHSEGKVLEKQPYELDEAYRLKKPLRRKKEKIKRLLPLLDKHLTLGVQQGYLVGKRENPSDTYWTKQEGNAALDKVTLKLSQMKI
jgi:hypothetical protein